MKLAVSDWYPYQHQATAFEQLLGGPGLERVPLQTLSGPLHDPEAGPFIALIGDGPLPLLGLPSMVEAMHRRDPSRGLLPVDPIVRARVRGFATMIEERFSRYCVSDIKTHPDWQRPTWNGASDAPERVLETPPMLVAVEDQQAGVTSSYLIGETPTLPDALLAALWWTIEDQGRQADLEALPWLNAWHERACSGAPFRRDPAVRRPA